jgi:tRNA(Ser,Leu) C12 N-acetylase TAN1
MHDDYDTKRLQEVFRVICKKCGSEDVRVEIGSRVCEDDFTEVALRCRACEQAEWAYYA